MTDQPGRFALTVGLAGIAGVLQGGQLANIPDLVKDHSRLGIELSPAEITLILSVLTLLSIVVTVGIFLAGYWWTRRVDLPGRYGRFAGTLFGAAIIGLGVGYLGTVLLLAEPGALPNEALPSIDDAGSAIASVIWIPFVGLAGGTIAQYRSASDSSLRPGPRDGYTVRFFVAVGLAGVAGLLRSLGPHLLPLLMEYHSILGLELSSRETGRSLTAISSALTLLSVVVTISLFLAGYVWARRSDVPAAYGYFAVSLFGAAVVGLGVGFLAMFLLLPNQPWLSTIGRFGIFVVSTISVPIPGLAGGAIAQYRSVTDTP